VYLAREVAARLREEFDDPRLGVKFDPNLKRWVVYVRRKMLSGERKWPVGIAEDGSIGPGESIIRSVEPYDDIVWTVQVDEQYHSLDPNLIRRALEQRDTHHRDVAKEVLGEVARRKAAAAKDRRDDLRQRSLYYRRAFSKMADEMGLVGKPDYSKVVGENAS
jgi:hypothetical protein